MDNRNNAQRELRFVGISRIWKVFKQLWWIIVILMIAAMLFTAAYQYRERNTKMNTKMYYTNTQVYLEKEKPQGSTNLGVNYSALLVSDSVLEAISHTTEGMNSADIKDAVLFSQTNGSKVLSITILTDTKTNCDAIMSGIMKYGFENVAAVTGDSQLTVLSYPETAKEMHVQENNTTNVSGVGFDNPSEKYSLTEWGSFVQSELSMTAFIKSVVISGMIALFMGVLIIFVYAVISRRIQFKEDLMSFGYIGCIPMDKNQALADASGRIQKFSPNAAIFLRSIGSTEECDDIDAEISGRLCEAGYDVADIGGAIANDEVDTVEFGEIKAKDYAGHIGALKKKYDYILVNAANIKGDTKTALMQNACDGIVLLVAKGDVKSDDVQNVIDEITVEGRSVIGSILVKGKKHRKGKHA